MLGGRQIHSSRFATEDAFPPERSCIVNRRLSILIITVIVIGLTAPSRADDGWSLSKLNPFKKKTSTSSRTHASVSDDGSKASGFPHVAMPDWGAASHASRARTPKPRKKPSTMTKLNQSTKDFLGKTKDVLMPWSSSSKSSSSKKKKSRTRSTSRSKKKTSFLTSWLPKKEPKPKPKTLKSFLGQRRPNY